MAQGAKKKLTSFDQHEGEIIVESIKDLTNKEQAEISQEYDKLEKDDIQIPLFHESDIPLVTEEQVEEALAAMDTNKSNVEGDVPAKVLKHFSRQLRKPVANVINSMIRPDILKLETVTPK